MAGHPYSSPRLKTHEEIAMGAVVAAVLFFAAVGVISTGYFILRLFS